MFRNYVKIALRNLIKHRGYTLINVLGLAIGMAACLLMLVFVQDELSYDKLHEQTPRIFRITDQWTAGGISEDLATVPFPVGRVLKMENADAIQNVVRMYRPSTWGNSTVMSFGDDVFVEEDLMFADSTFFQIFDFPFEQGSPENALASPNSIVLTKGTAQKYFGDDNPLGKRLTLNNQLDLEVTGVLENIPHNSHIKFDMLSTIGAMKNWWGWSGFEENWIWQSTWTYFVLENPQAAGAIQQQLPDFIQRHFPESIKDGTILTLQPLRDIHLRSQRYLEIATNSNIMYVYIFSAIAGLVLLIACINFMNLATARSASRAKEVGMRKVLGAYRTSLMRQFLSESVLLSLCSLVVAVVLIEASLPLFNSLTGKSLEMNYFENPLAIFGLLAIGLLVGILAGSYPAFYLSGFRPMQVLKGSIKGRGSASGESRLRKGLVVSQFVVSLVLLICISIIYNQLHYLRNKDLGIDKDQVVYFNLYGNLFQQYSAFKNELLRHKDVLSVSLIGGSVPGLEDGIANSFVAEGMQPDKPKWIGIVTASHDIEKVLGLDLVAGRWFSTAFPTDSAEAFMINETAARDFGWDVETAVGKKLDRVNSDGRVTQAGRVIGVVKDFHFEPLHEDLKPLVMRFGGGQFAVRLSAKNIPPAMDHIKETWDNFASEWPLNYRFLDDDLEALYRREQKLGQIIQYFAVLAIFIACLGLFGLASFTAEQRTKEIGIRKVLGASVASVVSLVSKEFTKLVVIAFVVASPIAYWAMSKWLENFAYRVGISVWVFVLAGGAALLIALITVSSQAIKAALTNPVEALKYE
jgi:putative ABC transport system permease protein